MWELTRNHRLDMCSDIYVSVVANDCQPFLIYALSVSVLYLHNGVLVLFLETGSFHIA